MMRRRKRETWVKPAWCVNKSYGHRASCSPDSPEAVSQASCRDAVRSTQCPEERPPEAGPLSAIRRKTLPWNWSSSSTSLGLQHLVMK